jgi:hypothetical protein
MKENEKLDTCTPIGRLFINGLIYFLVYNVDNLRAKWESDCHRFLVIPIKSLDYRDGVEIFSWARHITISGDFLIEYGACNKIQCMRPPEEW